MREAMAEYVRHHRCYNADPNVSIADWDRGVRAIEREAVAQALTVERARPRLAGPFTEMGDAFEAGIDDVTTCYAGTIDECIAAILAALRDEP